MFPVVQNKVFKMSTSQAALPAQLASCGKNPTKQMKCQLDLIFTITVNIFFIYVANS